MKNKIKRSLFAALAATTIMFSPVKLYAASIAETVEIAVNSNPEVRAAYIAKISKQSELKEKKSGFYPVLGMDASFERMKVTDFNTRARTTGGSDTGYGGDANFKISQMIFDGNSVLNNYRASKSRLDASNYDFYKKTSDVAIKAVIAHLNFLRMQELEFITNEYLADLAEYEKKLQALVDDGAADLSALLQAQEVKALTNNYLLDYKQQREFATADYQQIVGRLPDDNMTISDIDVMAGKSVPKTIAEAIEIAKLKQPILYAAKYTLEALDYEVKAEKAKILPRLDAEISHYRRDQRDSFGGEVEDSSAMLKMQWNFETGGGQKARIAKRRQDREEARFRKLSIERELEKRIRQAMAKYNIAIDRLKLHDKRQKTNKDIFENYESQFEGGKRTILELVNIRNQLYRANIEYMNAYYDYYTAQFEFLNEIGTLNEALDIKIYKIAKKAE